MPMVKYHYLWYAYESVLGGWGVCECVCVGGGSGGYSDLSGGAAM